MLFLGKTLEEAISAAEKETGKNRDEIIFTINEKKAGIFKSSTFEIEIKGFKTAGQIGIKDGKVSYYNGDLPPSITPCDNVLVRVNGEAINKTTAINNGDSVIIDTINTNPERSISLNVSDDNMEAYIDVCYSIGKTYKVVDTEASRNILIETKIIDEKHPERYTREDVDKIIKENKIVYGVKWENIPKVIKEGRFLIASGIEPIQPIDDSIKIFFDTEHKKKPVEIDGKVDYYNIYELESVKKGDVLALRNEGKDGKPGFDIYGKIISPNKRIIKKVKKVPGCQVLDNGNRLIADIDGLVSLKNEIICVFPSYVVKGNVDIKTGNLNFDGDIVVYGNVLEGLSINAANNINIYGGAAGASILSGGNIKVESNIISSVLRAGNRQINDMEAFKYLQSFREFIEIIVNVYSSLYKSNQIPEGIKSGKLFKVLLESKLKKYKEMIITGNNFIEKNDIRNEIANLWKECMAFYQSIENDSTECFNLAEILKKSLDEFINRFKAITSPADVKFKYCQNSDIYASRDVNINGKGSYNSIIKAENKVTFTGYPGVMRGGEAYGKMGIEAKEVGSNAGVSTLLKTSKDGTIQANIVYQNTTICVGEQFYIVENPVKMLKAYINKGELVVEKLKL